MSHTLWKIVLLLAIGVIVAAAFRRLKLPSIIGYLIAGVVIGPHALGLIPDDEQTRALAEFGVVFLMFSIGLEFSLPQLAAMRRTVFGLGSMQVGATIVLVTFAGQLFGLAWSQSFALAGILAMSSTAIPAKMLTERLELQSAHGRQIMGVALFQDLAVVLLLVLIPTLGFRPEQITSALALAGAKAAVILIVLLWFGRPLMRSWFHIVAGQKSSEVFVLNVLLVTLGLAWVTQLAGLSLALGAFVAGILISETEYRHQVEDYIKPFRDVLIGLFFITVGMLLDFGIVIAQARWVVMVLVLLLAGKFGVLWAATRLFKFDSAIATRVGLALAPAGEFGFVLLAQANALEMFESKVSQVVLAAMLLSMLLAPLLIAYSDAIVMRFCESEWMSRALSLHQLSVQAMTRDHHVVICGYGRSGQNLKRFLEQEGVSIIALDSDPSRVRAAVAAGESVVYGDAGRRETLVAAGIHRAAAVIVSFAEPAVALRILGHVRELNPRVPVVVRTADDGDLDRLKQAGAAEVVPDVLEGSLILGSHALLLLGVPLARVLKRIREMRRERYHLMRGFFHGMTDLGEDTEDHSQPRLQSVTLEERAYAVGKTLRELDLSRLAVEVTSLRRLNARNLNPEPDTLLERRDVVVLLGTPENLALAEERLLQG
jgi:monovalent cation:H+ antiporter-2, CPA2 family